MTEHETPETEAEDEEYEVGYGKPPKHTQFKKGQSGNPKRSKNKPITFRKALTEAVNKEVPATNNGALITTTRLVLAAEGIASLAAKAVPWAVKMVAELDGQGTADQRLKDEVLFLRKKLQKTNMELEKLKEQKKGGLLVLPKAPKTELEFEIRFGDPSETIQRIREHPEEIDELVWAYAEERGLKKPE